MARIRIIMLSVLAVFALGAVASASSASAFSLQWQVCEKVTGGKFTEDKCSKEGTPKEWEWKTLEAGETRKVKSTGGKFVLTAGTLKITCEKVTDTGEIFGGKPGTDESTETFTECKTAATKKCEVKSKGGTLGTINVPTNKTKLEEVEGTEVDNFEEKGTEFVTLEFSPEAACKEEKYVTTKVTGHVTGTTSKGTGTLTFPGKGSSLKAFGVAATLTGTSTQETTNGEAVTAI